MDLDLVKELLSTRQDGIVRHRESQTLEFKENFNYAGLAEYFRDFAAFANNKGGWLIFGVKDRPRRELLGLSGKSQEQFAESHQIEQQIMEQLKSLKLK